MKKNLTFLLLASIYVVVGIFSLRVHAQSSVDMDTQIKTAVTGEIQTLHAFVVDQIKKFDEQHPPAGAIHKFFVANGIGDDNDVVFWHHYKVSNTKFVGEVTVSHSVDTLNRVDTQIVYSTSLEKLTNENLNGEFAVNLANIRIEDCKPGECSLDDSGRDALQKQGLSELQIQMRSRAQHDPTVIFDEYGGVPTSALNITPRDFSDIIFLVKDLQSDLNQDLARILPCLRNQDVLVFKKYVSQTKNEFNGNNLDPNLEVSFDVPNNYLNNHREDPEENNNVQFKMAVGQVQRSETSNFTQGQVTGTLQVGLLRSTSKSAEMRLKQTGKPYHFTIGVFGDYVKVSDLETAVSSFCNQDGTLNKNQKEVELSSTTSDASIDKIFLSVKRP